jgi:hypothetical protein
MPPAVNYSNELRGTYECDEQGRITSPGKFEGEMCYLPYFYDLAMCGEGEFDDEDGTFTVTIEPEDRELFPQLAADHGDVTMIESDSGFVYEV